MNRILIIFSFLILLTSCGFDDSFDLALLDDFKRFQQIVDEHPDEIKGEYFDVADNYRWIVESNFERLFKFMDERDRERFITLFETEKIQRIEIRIPNRIEFKIRPDYNNSLLQSEWKELWIIYDTRQTESFDKSEQVKAIKLENNLYKLIKTGKRYIGG